jgi:colicin import membrane protein
VTLTPSYKNSLIAAVLLHFSLAIMLFIEPSSNKPPVLELTDHPDLIQSELSQKAPSQEPIKAVSVDAQEVMKTVNRLKQQHLQQQQAEKTRQANLNKQVELARKARIDEQQHLKKLKDEAEKIAISHKKQLEEEKKRLAEMKKQQQQEAEKLVLIKKKQDLAKAEAAQAEAKRLIEAKQKQAAKEKADFERKKQDSLRQAAVDSEKNARIAGEVDRYKALIISAISRQWILPENAQTNLSSQFRIRLAPDGSVLEVTLTRGSGDSVLDHSAQSAIYKASPLPVPTDPAAFNTFRDISLTVRPENARG